MKKILKSALILIWPIQTRDEVKSGGQVFTRYRLNPWNPFSYPAVLIAALMFFVIGGISLLVSGWVNPFKWF